MRVEILNTGTELLLGSVLNTHVRLFAEALFPMGLRIQRQVTVPDGNPIRDAIAETPGRAEIVLITGGLGPTTDDITRETVSEWLGLEMTRDASVVAAIEDRFARRGLTMTPRNLRQADRPAAATVLPNPNGTAPGLYLPPQPVPCRDGIASPHLFLLPGPPRELKPMLWDHVLPTLRGIAPPRGADKNLRLLRLVGVGESMVEHEIGEALLALGLELGYCARPNEVDVRLIGTVEQLERGEAIVRDAFELELVSDDERTLEQVVVDELTSAGRTLATAESCTGGALAHRVTNVPGASKIFLAGFVTYANEAKTRDLGVPEEVIAAHGAVSEAVAAAMAEGARRRAGTDFGLSTTGIAGPDGGTAEKPLGTVWIGFSAAGGRPTAERHLFIREREAFKECVVQEALKRLLEYIRPRKVSPVVVPSMGSGNQRACGS